MISKLILCAAGLLMLAGCAKPTPSTPPATSATLKGASAIDLTVSPTPLRSLDTSSFTVTATDHQGHPIDNATVTVDLKMPSMEMPKNEIACKQSKPGEYSGTGRFTMSGDWQAHVAIKENGKIREQNFPLTVK